MDEINQLKKLMEAVNTPYNDAAEMQDRIDAEGGEEVSKSTPRYRLEKDYIGDRTTIKIVFKGRVLMEIDESDWIGLVNEYEGR